MYLKMVNYNDTKHITQLLQGTSVGISIDVVISDFKFEVITLFTKTM